MSSALCMDKYRAHELVKAHGIEVPSCVYLQHQQDYPNKKPDIMGLQLPVYVKPVKSGSSLGMCRLESFDHLDQAVFEAFQYDDCVLIEEEAVSYTHLRAHETRHDIVCRLLLEKKKKHNQ